MISQGHIYTSCVYESDEYRLTPPDASPASNLNTHPAPPNRPELLDGHRVHTRLGMLTAPAPGLRTAEIFGQEDPEAKAYVAGAFVLRPGALQFGF